MNENSNLSLNEELNIVLENAVSNSTIKKEKKRDLININKIDITDNTSYKYYSVKAIEEIKNSNKKGFDTNIENALEINNNETVLLTTLLLANIKNDKLFNSWLDRVFNLLEDNNYEHNTILVLDYLYNNTNKDIKLSIENKFKQIYNLTYEKKKFKELFSNNNIINDFSYIELYASNYENTLSYLENIRIYNNFIEKKSEIINSEILVKSDYVINNLDKDLNYTSLCDLIFIDELSSDFKLMIINLFENIVSNLIKKETPNDEIGININEWSGHTKDGSNEKELINSIINYVRKPFISDINSIRFINYKTIYSMVFVLIGLIVVFFNSIIGGSILIVGIISLIYFLFEVKVLKENTLKFCDETVDKYVSELANTIAEIVDIKFEINEKVNNK